MRQRRAIFLDVDGTFADRGVVPARHVAAVRAARAAGHLVLLCTGRPRSMLPERILEAGFDGFVAAAGGYVEVAGEVLVDRRFPAALAARVVEVLDTHDVAYVLEAPDALYGPLGIDERLRSILSGQLGGDDEQEGPVDILRALRMSADLTGASFGKVTMFDSPVPIASLGTTLGAEVGVLPSSIPGMGDSAGELFLTGVHKAAGMAVVAEHLGVAQRDTVAFGDGLNDLEMLEYAGVGVAIEGADPRVLAVSDRTARGPGEEGLADAFAALELL
ncbi:HAD hydrolase family protein [Georgenia muralis]